MEKYFKYLTENVEDLHRKPYLRVAIKSHMERNFRGIHTPKEISDFVNSQFNYKGTTNEEP